jgi:hypothetical protein
MKNRKVEMKNGHPKLSCLHQLKKTQYCFSGSRLVAVGERERQRYQSKSFPGDHMAKE